MTRNSLPIQDGRGTTLKPVKIGIVGDTHAYRFEQVPRELLDVLRQTGRIIHVGDFTTKDVLNGFRKLKEDRFHGVCGNADSLEVRQQLPKREVILIEGKRIGITHPIEGGPAEGLEDIVLAGFKNENLDAIVYGHSHDAKIQNINGLLLLNPGQGYNRDSYFGARASIAILTIEEEIRGEIVLF